MSTIELYGTMGWNIGEISEREILKRKRQECEGHLCGEVKIMVVEWLVWLANKRPQPPRLAILH